jgi:hypothetical protein
VIQRIRREEDGAVLLMVLAFVTFVGVLAVAVLNYATTNSLATARLRPVRAAQSAADGATEGAVNKLRQFRPAEQDAGGQWISNAPCPTNLYTYSPDGDEEYTVDCTNAVVSGPSGSQPASRTVRLTACPAQAFDDGATAASSNRLSSPTAGFTAADIGRGVNGSGIPAGTTITEVLDGTTVAMSASATATATGLKISTTCSPASSMVVARVKFAGAPPNVSATVQSWSVVR